MTIENNIVALQESQALCGLQLSLDRLSHSLRSSLGIVKSVVDDLVDGYKCEAQDLEQASHAVSAIVSTLNSFSAICVPIVIRHEDYQSITALPKLLDDACHIETTLTIELPTNNSCRLSLPLLRALCAITLFASTRANKYATKIHSDKPIIICRVNISAEHRFICEFELDQTNVSESMKLAPNGSIFDLAKSDHMPQSLGLVFANEVLEGNGGDATFTWKDNRLCLRCEAGEPLCDGILRGGQ